MSSPPSDLHQTQVVLVALANYKTPLEPCPWAITDVLGLEQELTFQHRSVKCTPIIVDGTTSSIERTILSACKETPEELLIYLTGHTSGLGRELPTQHPATSSTRSPQGVEVQQEHEDDEIPPVSLLLPNGGALNGYEIAHRLIYSALKGTSVMRVGLVLDVCFAGAVLADKVLYNLLSDFPGKSVTIFGASGPSEKAVATDGIGSLYISKYLKPALEASRINDEPSSQAIDNANKLSRTSLVRNLQRLLDSSSSMALPAITDLTDTLSQTPFVSCIMGPIDQRISRTSSSSWAYDATLDRRSAYQALAQVVLLHLTVLVISFAWGSSSITASIITFLCCLFQCFSLCFSGCKVFGRLWKASSSPSLGKHHTLSLTSPISTTSASPTT